MTEAAETARRIMEHKAAGGRVWTTNYGGAREIGKAWAEGSSLFVFSGRNSRATCIPANYVSTAGKREWRNLAFR